MRHWLSGFTFLAAAVAGSAAAHADGDSCAAPRALAVSAGFRHTCAIRDDHTLWCWGDNFDGQLGNGSHAAASTPVQVSALGDHVRSVSASDQHTCALTFDGTVYCWGGNYSGQLGQGNTSGSAVPLAVAGLGDRVRDVQTGPGIACALLHDRSLRCWGANSDGLLGTGGNANQLTPAPVQGLDGVPIARLSQLRTHCALDLAGELFCWGPNQNGQLGLGDLVDRPLPTRVDAFAGPVTGIAARSQSTCALSDGQLWCWGFDMDGEVGDGSVVPGYPFAVPSPRALALAGVSQVANGTEHACAVTGGGQVSCWGVNGNGELGLGDTSTRTTPTPLALAEVQSLSLGQGHSCAIRDDGSLWCWGSNFLGQLGVGDTSNRLTPTPVALPAP